jgi:fatty-acyl-CoA synthase
MEADGYFRIVDRSKDLVKSGGEWISSVELEGAVLAHPAVRDAASWASPSQRWDERPAVGRARSAAGASPVAARPAPTFLVGTVRGKWWLPDELVVVDERPEDQRRQVRQEGDPGHAGRPPVLP